ncbi:MAG: flagellar biosynthesis anti-sigma factor FlgM [Tepidanaerobacteraceae bacterium]|jgi:negative regulator of flagellin synthesis FlgM|nr:flagellar biosynthesis anti-sigma factor FlgM [Tepidanaerobacteraceae bacterium]
MNISRSQLESCVRIYREQSGKIRRDSEKEKPDKSGADSFILSAEAKELLQAIKSAGTEQDVREEKVAALREKINSGTYNIDGELVAEKMLEEHFGSAYI